MLNCVGACIFGMATEYTEKLLAELSCPGSKRGEIRRNGMSFHPFRRLPAAMGTRSKTQVKITINVPLFKKLRDIIFFCGTINLGVKKVEAPSKCPEKWLIK